MPRNLEIKAKVTDLSVARSVAESLPAHFAQRLLQVDTYFNVSQGRLKLREINSEQAELIYYERQEDSFDRQSHFDIVPIDHPKELKLVLERAYGVRQVVKKERHLYMFNQTRIHLDNVDGLGSFIEFEVPIHSSLEEAQGILNHLMETFAIQPEECILNSYGDILHQRARQERMEV